MPLYEYVCPTDGIRVIKDLTFQEYAEAGEFVCDECGSVLRRMWSAFNFRVSRA